MKGGRGRKKPIRPETWRVYLSAEYHLLRNAGLIKPWKKLLHESEWPEQPWDWPDGDAITEQVIAEAWEAQ